MSVAITTIVIATALFSIVHGGIHVICPPVPPLIPVVPVVPIGGIFELFGPIGFAGLPPTEMIGQYGGMGKYGGFQFGGQELSGKQGMYGMSMHNFFPKMGNYQYYQQTYDPNWRSYTQGKNTRHLHALLSYLQYSY